MQLETLFEKCDFRPNPQQRKAIKTIDGPLLIIAGPGSGKTQVLIMRALNVILCHEIDPENVLLCTFTEKAAMQLKERLRFYMGRCAPGKDIAGMAVGTVHSICNDIIQENVNDIEGLGKHYEVVEELTQQLFIYQHFKKIFEDFKGSSWESRYHGKWRTIGEGRVFLNKVTEELIDPGELVDSDDIFLSELGSYYAAYSRELIKAGKIDFSHQQSVALDLIKRKKAVRRQLQSRFKFIMVDEYQDTNYVQERLFFELAQPEYNLCVVGDDDQSLYRFRGATVRNIIEFPKHFKKKSHELREANLYTNYRSHPKIIQGYNTFMDSDIWDGPRGARYRYEKRIKADPKRKFPEYPSLLRVDSSGGASHYQKVAELVKWLKQNGLIQDYNEVAILLRSIKGKEGQHYEEALRGKGIKCYAPRTGRLLERREIMELIGCFTWILDWKAMGYEPWGHKLERLYEYLDECLLLTEELVSKGDGRLKKFLDGRRKTLGAMAKGDSLDEGLLDVFYELLSFEPFASYLKDEPRARALSTISSSLAVFQQYYKYPVFSGDFEWFRRWFVNSFFNLLYDQGLGEYEDPYEVFPSGYVQLMTIHQAKGLEFPVVIVGTLTGEPWRAPEADVLLSSYFKRKPFEPEHLISEFDHRRLFYVAFSRAANLLVLATPKGPNHRFADIWSRAADFDDVSLDVFRKMPKREPIPLNRKMEFSLTSHINVYEVCPRQYLMYNEYDFSPSRSAQMVFGSVVHETIEDIHKHILRSGLKGLTEGRIVDYFDANYRSLIMAGNHPIGEKQILEAFAQVVNYSEKNKAWFVNVRETEVELTVDKEDYFLVGRIDLILGKDERLELVDFKAQQRPPDDHPFIASCRKQLAIYSHALGLKKGFLPDRTLVYWTGEMDPEDARMEVRITPSQVESAGRHFDRVVKKIRSADFKVKKRPDRKVCNECDFRYGCKTLTK